MAVVNSSWDGSAGRFTDEQYERSCVLDRTTCGGDWKNKPVKERCSLPIKEPNGDINSNGVKAAAGRISQVTDACPGAIASAKTKLRSAYKTIGEDPPDSIKANSAELSPKHRERALASMPGEWELRDDGQNKRDGSLGTLTGHFAVFNRWTEINSFWEGRFLERIAPGAMTKTFQENRQGMRVLFQHGRDPAIGMKPLGPIMELEQDDTGARYDVDFMDTSYNRDLQPGLKNGQYGASFRFMVIQEEVNNEPEKSDYNPEGIPERTLKEVKVREFGPVTFGAYEEATSGLRSLNDTLIELGAREGGFDLGLFVGADPERLQQFFDHLRGETATTGNGRSEPPPEVAPQPETPPSEGTLETEAARQDLVTTKTFTEEPKWKL